jgi:hypothetical protein
MFSSNIPQQTKEILFGKNETDFAWSSFTDQVIGGLSRASVLLNHEELIFEGTVVPSVHSSWAGFRSKKQLQDLSSYKFIELKIKTDGQPFEIQLEWNEAWQDEKLSQKVDIVGNQWKVMHLEMEKFRLFNIYEGYLTRRPKLQECLSNVLRYNFLFKRDEKDDVQFEIEYIKFH